MKTIKKLMLLIIISGFLILTNSFSCAKTDTGSTGLPSSQVWTITFDHCSLGTCGTNVTILKGGAISQKDNGVSVKTFNGACTYYAPISGQWSGTIFKFTMNGGACGEQCQGFTQGTAEGEYGTAIRATGSITWNFNNQSSFSDTWTALFQH